ncbi:unnamed protein product [Lymnaea stagnalis]|uniref:VWFA domain-containing protein n=1 Tax=Lymnaea stagnalis TaxID=6523 RepID=A0AAV2H1F4_LYMST
MASLSLCCIALLVLSGLVSCQPDYDEDLYPDFNNLPPTRGEPPTRFEPVRDEVAAGCGNKVMDLYFILDSSTSIWINDYRREQQFVKDVIGRFDISARTTRVGILTFSDDITRPVISLNRYLNKQDLLASVTDQNLPYRTGVTNTDQAIRFVRESPEFRQDITKVIVVVTDGGSRSPDVTAREAELAREQGFYLYVIGVGQYLDEREWRAIASDPDDSFIYNITNFRYLETVKYSLPSRACLLPPLAVGGSCAVIQPADLLFVAAPGGSQEAFTLIDNFVRRTEDANLLRASYLLENCVQAEDVPLREVSTYCERFSLGNPASAETYTDLLARLKRIARQSRELRGSNSQVAVLIIDDESLRLNRYAITNAARDLERSDGIELIVVDLGLRNLGNYVQGIPINRFNYIRFLQGSVTDQRQIQRLLLDRTCEAINRDQNIDVPPV